MMTQVGHIGGQVGKQGLIGARQSGGKVFDQRGS